MNCFLFGVLFFLLNGLSSGYTKLKEELNAPKKPLTCTSDEECQSLIPESKCIEDGNGKVCRCSADMLLSSDASRCLPRVTEYGSPCEDTIQCSALLSAGGICENKVCVCRSGYHYLRGSCWKNVGLHGKCFRDEQCFGDYEYVGFRCEGNKCKCRTNYRERLASGCRRERKAGESCNLGDDCVDGSKCQSMTCSGPNPVRRNGYSNSTTGRVKRVQKTSNCPGGMFRLNDECVRELGMKCNDDSECSHIKKAKCLDGSVCACEPVTFVAGENNRECLPVTRGMIEEIQRSSCKKDAQCGVFGADSICVNKRCACKNGTYFEIENKYCWTIKPLWESCSDTKDCHPKETNAECVRAKSGKLCFCKEGYHAKGLTCVPDALEVGDPCEINKDCLFPNSFCNSSKVCACQEQYYPKNGKCEPGVGKLCTSNADCDHLKNTECTADNQCRCLVNHTSSEDYKYCLPVVDFKKECLESFQCKFGLGELGECKQNVCDCHEDAHYYNGTCYKSKFLGQPCTKLPDCYPGSDPDSVICLKGYCSCSYDYRELNKTGICVKTNSAAGPKFHSISLTALVLFVALRR